ncbi:MAG TPA: D-alanyl-D-alanine carboxypeptidase/D-alanyl-D-alanine-endopeptidase, partial [Mycobacteriales bacterium]|nr:D-alanyl-D-alanine carboxypeptidase/D-alanyl-D-alanine-endopeptidase [Mycobacteriales bacterium]
IVVTGSIALGSDVDQEWATVWDPTRYAADVFERALSRHGVSVSGSVREQATPAAATPIAIHRSMTLGQMYVPFLKLSNNGHAEVLVKTMGAEKAGEGSWAPGLTVMRKALRNLGVDPDAMELVDGSGLSRMDLVPAQQITNVLLGAQKRPWFKLWYDALPISAQPDRFVGGTLRSRFVGTPAAGKIHAKTGSLTGVTTLSGYVTDADGERLIFSVMQNNLLDFDGESIEDAVGIRLAEFSRDGASAGVPVVPASKHTAPGLECSWLKAC